MHRVYLVDCALWESLFWLPCRLPSVTLSPPSIPLGQGEGGRGARVLPGTKGGKWGLKKGIK